MRYINEIKENEHVVEHYLCRQRQSLKSNNGRTYLSLKLMDKTGAVDGKVWELNNDIQQFDEGDFIKIDAVALIYQNNIQLKIGRIRRSREGEFELSDYIRATDKDVDELYGEIKKHVASLASPPLRRLIENMLVNDKENVLKFRLGSAAKNLHHNYMGGLIEHTLSVVQTCDFLCSRYKHVDRDLLIASALLHDIGKIHELSAMPVNDYTDEGQMIGHIVIGAEMITAGAANVEGFPDETRLLLKHMILSHHGSFEFGSPKLPCTIEALILHFADDLDAKVKMFEDTVETDRTPGRWTGYQKQFNRYLRKPDDCV